MEYISPKLWAALNGDKEAMKEISNEEAKQFIKGEK